MHKQRSMEKKNFVVVVVGDNVSAKDYSLLQNVLCSGCEKDKNKCQDSLKGLYREVTLA